MGKAGCILRLYWTLERGLSAREFPDVMYRLHCIQGRCGKFPVLIFGWMNVFVIRRPRPNRVVRLSVGYDLIMSFELTKSIHTPALDLLAAAEY